jgi:hypothetical protein
LLRHPASDGMLGHAREEDLAAFKVNEKQLFALNWGS